MSRMHLFNLLQAKGRSERKHQNSRDKGDMYILRYRVCGIVSGICICGSSEIT